MFYNVCYDGKEYNGVLRESKRNAEIQTALLATSRSPLLLGGYLEAYLGRLQLCLRNLSITFNVSKSTAVVFVKAARRIQKYRAMQFLGDPIQSVETDRYLGVTTDKQLT
jgi:hypothetical protein